MLEIISCGRKTVVGVAEYEVYLIELWNVFLPKDIFDKAIDNTIEGLRVLIRVEYCTHI